MGIISVNYSAYSKQKAMAYAAYMIAGSAFAKVEANKNIISCFRLHYAEMDNERKYKCEEIADGLMAGLGRMFLENISRMRCRMHMRYNEEDLCLVFSTEGFEEVICTINKEGQLDIKAVPAKEAAAA